MAVTGRVMPERELQPIPWAAIMRAVTILLEDADQEVKKLHGEGWSVYRVQNHIRIDIPQGE